jgi:precorrin-6B methylase 2
MRYIINTTDDEGLIGVQISDWVKKGKVELIEKADPAAVIAANLEKAAKALETLKKAGYNSYVMKVYLQHETKMAMRDIDALMRSQDDFFRAIGVKK